MERAGRKENRTRTTIRRWRDRGKRRKTEQQDREKKRKESEQIK